MFSELPGIEAFVYTAEARSFRRAAERLGLTPAAISKAVAKLEERLDAPLLERTSRSVTLTPEGAAFLYHCRHALDALIAGRDEVLEASRVARGTLRVSAPMILGPAVVRILPRLSARHPHLGVDLNITDRHVKLEQENVDVAVRVGDLEDSALLARRLSRPRWVTAASPAYLAQHGVPKSPQDLRAHRCLKFRTTRGRFAPWQFAEQPGGDGQAVEVPTRTSMDQGNLLVQAAVEGIGLVQALDFLVADHLRSGELVEVLPLRWARGPAVHVVCRARRKRTPKIRVFIDLLNEAFNVAGVAPRPGR